MRTHYLYAYHLTKYMGGRSGGFDAAIIAAFLLCMNTGNLLIFSSALMVDMGFVSRENISFNFRIAYVLSFFFFLFVILRKRRQYIECDFKPLVEGHGLIWFSATYFALTILFLYLALVYVSNLT